MDDATARALNDINRAFYREHAGEFSETRAEPWEGWRRLVPLLETLPPPGAALRLLDVGCGNARLGRFLAGALERPLTYRGVDSSSRLLAEAARALPDATFETRDLVDDPLPPDPGGTGHDCVAAFGVLHHIPGRRRRRALLEALCARVRTGGVLALAFWDFGSHSRFASRHVEIDDYNRRAPRPLARGALEPGDALLRGGAGADAVRYCHWTDAAEEAELLSGLPLADLDAYRSDGREGTLNRYRLLRRVDARAAR